MNSQFRCLLASLPFFLIGGCTTVTIYQSNGTLERSGHFGFVSICPVVEDGPVVIETRSIGYSKTATDIAIGLSTSSLVMIPDGQSVVLCSPDSESYFNINEMRNVKLNDGS